MSQSCTVSFAMLAALLLGHCCIGVAGIESVKKGSRLHKYANFRREGRIQESDPTTSTNGAGPESSEENNITPATQGSNVTTATTGNGNDGTAPTSQKSPGKPVPKPEPQETGKCPKDGTFSETPDEFGNCQCQKEFKCFDMRVVEEAERNAKEMSAEAAKEVMNITREDQKDKGPGCLKNLKKLDDPSKAPTCDGTNCAKSEVDFILGCDHCKCLKPKEKPAESGASMAIYNGAVALTVAVSGMTMLGM